MRCFWTIVLLNAAYAGKKKKGKVPTPVQDDSSESMLSNVQLDCGAPQKANSRWIGELGEKIVGGTEIFDEKAWPWLVSINSVCGGSFIDAQHVLTAAHCVDYTGEVAGIHPSKVTGMNIFHGAKSFDGNGGQTVKVEAIYEHYDFMRTSLFNDIALIRLSKPVKFDDFSSAVCLPEKNEFVADGTSTYVAGWGYMNEDAFWVQDVAREVMVPVVPDEWCDDAYDRQIREATELCAGYKSGGKDACQGDSGGPLVTRDDGGKGATLQGIVSWGHGCARAGKYGVYTRVSAYIDWIQHAKAVLADCGNHKWCQDGTKQVSGNAGPGEIEKEEGGEDGNGVGATNAPTTKAPKKTKAPANKPQQDNHAECKGVQFSAVTERDFVCESNGCFLECGTGSEITAVYGCMKKGWQNLKSKKDKPTSSNKASCGKTESSSGSSGSSSSSSESFAKCGTLKKTGSNVKLVCKTKGKKNKPDSCTASCVGSMVVYDNASIRTDSRQSVLGDIKCGKKGYQLSKKSTGLKNFRCSNEGSRTINSPLLTSQVEKHVETSTKPPRVVHDQAKIVSGMDLEAAFAKPTGPMVTDLVNFEITIGGKSAGVISIGLFGEVAPKTVQNFATLASKPAGQGYMGSVFHRVIPNFMIQGGDFTHGTGIGGMSIWGTNFPDENFNLKHTTEGLLSMANRGPDTNGSQFFITTVLTPWLDDKHVVFGKVVRGMDVVRNIERQPANTKNRPMQEVKIARSQHQTLLDPFPINL